MLLLNFWRSTIGKKVVMAVTGLIWVGFVSGHMLGHLQMFQSAAKYNAYAHFLQSLGGLLWLVRGVLLLAIVVHVVAAVQLSRRRLQARPVGYAKGSQWEVSTFASRYIRWGGALLLAFIIFHILHFTTLNIFPEYRALDVYSRMIVAFQKPWLLGFYVVSMLALGLHLYHGIWSSVRTIGASRPTDNPLRRRLSAAVAVVVALGFVVVPIAIAVGVIRPETNAGERTAATAARTSQER